MIISGVVSARDDLFTNQYCISSTIPASTTIRAAATNKTIIARPEWNLNGPILACFGLLLPSSLVENCEFTRLEAHFNGISPFKLYPKSNLNYTLRDQFCKCDKNKTLTSLESKQSCSKNYSSFWRIGDKEPKWLFRRARLCSTWNSICYLLTMKIESRKFVSEWHCFAIVLPFRAIWNFKWNVLPCENVWSYHFGWLWFAYPDMQSVKADLSRRHQSVHCFDPLPH